MASPQHIHVQLRRTDTGQPWGFTMKGGAQMQMPLFIEKITPNGRAHRAGMKQGDLIVVICGTNVAKFSHDAAKSEILRAGNELDFTLQRGTPSGRNPMEALAHIQAGGSIASGPGSPIPAAELRGEVVEEPTARLGGPVYKDVRPVTYQVLEDQLPPDPNQGQALRRSTTPSSPAPGANDPRSQVVNEHTCSFGGPVYKDITSRTYQVLEEQLPPDTTGQRENPHGVLLPPDTTGQPKPSSIFDRKRQERSAYLHAGGPTIQKAFGEGIH